MPIRTVIKNTLKLFLLSLNSIPPIRVIPLLLYHSIDDSGRIDSVSPEAFAEQMEYLYKNQYRVISLDEVGDYIKDVGKNEFHRVLAITFDDGYESIYKYALPILHKYDFTASVFLPTKYIGKYSEWFDHSIPLLTWRQIEAMKKKGITFGSHGHSHKDLTDLTEKQAREELEISKKILEEKLDGPVIYISFPFSKSNDIIENIALGCGYKTLFSAVGAERSKMSKNPHLLLRRSVMRIDKLFSFKFLLSNTYQYYFDIKRLMGLL